jgi:hypothetical protein
MPCGVVTRDHAALALTGSVDLRSNVVFKVIPMFGCSFSLSVSTQSKDFVPATILDTERL